MTRPAHGGDFLRVDSPVGASLGGDLFPGLAFSGNPLDRVSEKRDDEAFVSALAAREDARTVLIARDAPTLRQTDGAPSPYFALPELAAIGRVTETALLGVRASGAPVFAAALADEAVAAVGEKEATVSYDTRQLAIAGRPDLALRDMRSLAVDGLLDGADVAILAQAKALLARLQGHNVVFPTVWRTKKQAWLRPLQHNAAVANNDIRDLARGQATISVPNWAAVIQRRPALQYDGIHLTPAGLVVRYPPGSSSPPPRARGARQGEPGTVRRLIPARVSAGARVRAPGAGTR